MTTLTTSGQTSTIQGVLCGRVVVAGAPIAGAEVLLLLGDQMIAHASTGPRGRYLFTRVPHGEYVLRIAPPDPSRYLPTADTPAISGDSITRIDLVLEPPRPKNLWVG
jgi:hypothetical protein